MISRTRSQVQHRQARTYCRPLRMRSQRFRELLAFCSLRTSTGPMRIHTHVCRIRLELCSRGRTDGVSGSCIATPLPSTSAAERAINVVLDAADGTDGAVTDAALDAVEALPSVARNTVAEAHEGSMGFLNH